MANRMLLWRALRDTSGVLSSNGSSTLQTYVLGEACERTQCLKVTCWAEELRITITVPCEVSNRGRFAVPAHMLRKILRGAGSEDVELEEKASQMLHAKCGKGDFVLQEHNPAEFPELEAEERMDSGLALSLDVTWLRSALFMPHRVVEWTRDDPPWTRGVLVDICGEEGKFVSMSRTQLAVIHRRARGFDDLKAMIPSRTVETLVCIPMSNRRTDNATLRVGSSAALFSIGEIEIYSKLLEVEHYPNWKPRLPSEQSNPPIELDRKRLLEVIGRMTVAASSAGTWEGMGYDAGPFEFRPVRLGPVLCTLAPSSITFECRVRNEVQSVETIFGQYDGASIKSIYPVRQLQRVLATLRTESVSLQVVGEMGPCVISSREAPDFQCVLSPIWTE